MKLFYKLMSLALLFISTGLYAQTYVSDTTTKQHITGYGQTFTSTFTAIPGGGWGTGTLIVYFEGDFGDNTEYITVTDEGGNTIGQAGPYTSGLDCDGLDSVEIPFNALNIDTWLATGNDVSFGFAATSNVDPGVCTALYFQCRIRYNFCIAGVPQNLAFFTLSDSLFCKYDNSITLSGQPAGGTFSGPGVTGNTFSPSTLTPGSIYNITYTATDGIGCTTSFSRPVRILTAPIVSDTVACPGTAPLLNVDGGGTFVWFYDNGLTQVVDSGNTVTANPIDQTTSYYVARLSTTSSFEMNSLTTGNFQIVDHNTASGDDRGGIAVTPNYVYVVGDVNTVRADASNLANQVSLPIRDALFSDLETGELFSLWSTADNDNPNYNNSFMTVDAIQGLDASMNFTGVITPIDNPFQVDYGSAIFAGYGFVGVYSGADGHIYVISLNDFSVQDLGDHSAITLYGSENWSDWGVLEYDGFDFYAVYRSWSGSGNEIRRRNLTTGNETMVIDFVNGVNDLSSFTFSPWNNRWYFHHEGGSGTFGGSTETMGYADGTYSSTVLTSNSLGCYSEVEVTVNNIDLGPDRISCDSAGPVILFAGLGFDSYTWNNVNNNYNAYPVTESGVYIVEAVDSYNCTASDTIIVTIAGCTGLDENGTMVNVKLYPNPVTENATLSIESALTQELQVRMTDMQGRTLQNYSIQAIQGTNSFNVDASALRPGVYMIQLQGSEGMHKTISFVKQ